MQALNITSAEIGNTHALLSNSAHLCRNQKQQGIK